MAIKRKWLDRRSQYSRELRKNFLVICEGSRTEPRYFRDLQSELRLRVQVDSFGKGHNTLSLVEQTINYIAKRKSDYFQVWCVFDKDDFSAGDFNGAIQLARSRGFNVAYSNEAFELWFLLHFIYIDTAQSRTNLIAKLEGHLGKGYSKTEPICREILPKINQAIRNAERLLGEYSPVNPASNNPSTTVHLLVLELQKHASN